MINFRSAGRRATRGLVPLVMLVIASAAAAQRAEAQRPREAFVHVLSNLRDITREDVAGQQDRPQSFQIIGLEHPNRPTILSRPGGTQMDVSSFANSWLMSRGRTYCTATSVGPRTILTAAHCVEDKKRYRFEQGLLHLTATCHRLPGFDDATLATACGVPAPTQSASLDLAVCVLDKGSANFSTQPYGFESVSLAAGPATGAQIGIDTFVGCDIEFGRLSFNALRFSLESWGKPAVAGGVFVGEGLCHGDSGAPWTIGWPPGGPIVAVHSTLDGERSWGARLDQECAKNFLSGFAKKSPVCGIPSSTPTTCRP